MGMSHFLPSMNIDCTSSIRESITIFIRVVRNVAMILYRDPKRLTGRKSFSVNMSFIFGAREMKDELHPFLSQLLFSKCFTSSIISFFIKTHFFHEFKRKSNWFGAFLQPHHQIASLISSSLNGFSIEIQSSRLSRLKFLLMNIGREVCFVYPKIIPYDVPYVGRQLS